MLDASFGGRRPGSLSLPAAADAPLLRTDRAVEHFSRREDGKDIALFVAASPGEDAIDLAGAGSGLFSWLLEEGATGAADEDRDGVVQVAELHAYLEREVASRAGLEGTPQTPHLSRQGRRPTTGDPGMKAP